MTEQKFMAFWEYDKFPFTLYSEVETFDTARPNVAKVKGYGGAWFKYKHVCPKEVGETLAVKLDEIEKRYKRELTKVNIKYSQELAKISKEYGLAMPDHVK